MLWLIDILNLDKIVHNSSDLNKCLKSLYYLSLNFAICS